MPVARGQLRNVATSLMSGATAHTVKPSLAAPETLAPILGRRKALPLKVMLLGAVSAALGLVCAGGVAKLRQRPAPLMHIVSGSPVMKHATDGESVRWHGAKHKIYFDASLDGLDQHARDAVQLGFGAWISSGAKLPNVDFDSTSGAKFGQTPNGKSEVMYGPITLAGHENDLALTVTFSDAKTGEVVESDMIFNSHHPYGLLRQSSSKGSADDKQEGTPDCGQRYDLQSVAAHEAGHFFGLGEDFDSKQATMYFSTGRCETNKRVLQNSDETTMAALYTASDVQAASDDPSVDTAKGCGGAHIGQGRASGSSSLLFVLGGLGFARWQRRRKPAR
jgi:hypothetical protein